MDFLELHELFRNFRRDLKPKSSKETIPIKKLPNKSFLLCHISGDLFCRKAQKEADKCKQKSRRKANSEKKETK